MGFYEKAFLNEPGAAFLLNPIDEQPLDKKESSHTSASLYKNDDCLRSPELNKKESGNSPSNIFSPVILDFLGDENFFPEFDEQKRVKFKTEFRKRDRQESEESNLEEY